MDRNWATGSSFCKRHLHRERLHLPGVSGGALAAVFGIYERMIAFLSNLTKNFKENVLFFLPVGLGGVFGMFLFSFVVSYMLGNAETYTLWFFIGCIVGMMPALFRQSAKKGRKPWHLVLMALTCAASYALLTALQSIVAVEMPKNILTWLMAGGIIGLGVIVPGLSPSNLLVYMNLYKPMADGIKDMDFGVVLPLLVGVAACVILLSKLMNTSSRRRTRCLPLYPGFRIRFDADHRALRLQLSEPGRLLCLVALAAGAALALFMSRLEDRYKPED
jgi:putative membrane protein